MRAVLLPGVDRPLELVERPVPAPGQGEVRIRVQACGVCGSDLFLQSGGFGEEKLPRIPGHEAAGMVDGVGPGVHGWAPGDQAALYYIDADPDGAWARAGRENLDPALTRMGVDVDGAFAEYVVRPAHTLIRPPAPIDPTVLAVLTDAVATPYHALVRVARVQRGETLLVLGIGGIGSNAVQLGRHLGARVVAASRGATKLALARRLGADEVVATGDAARRHEADEVVATGGADEVVATGDAARRHETDEVVATGGAEEVVARLRAACGGDGPDVVLQCAESAALDEIAIAVAGPGARVILVGASRERFGLRSVDLIWRELSVMGSRGFTKRDVAEVIDLHIAGTITVDHLVGAVRPLEDANDALEDLRAGRVLRSVLTP
jgi:propanol-preferring alcohol dehydrogenase